MLIKEINEILKQLHSFYGVLRVAVNVHAHGIISEEWSELNPESKGIPHFPLARIDGFQYIIPSINNEAQYDQFVVETVQGTRLYSRADEGYVQSNIVEGSDLHKSLIHAGWNVKTSTTRTHRIHGHSTSQPCVSVNAASSSGLISVTILEGGHSRQGLITKSLFNMIKEAVLKFEGSIK